MPADYNSEPLQVIQTDPVNTIIPNMDNELAVYKPDYINLGFNTSTLKTLQSLGPTTRFKGKLKLDNETLTIDQTIETFTRTKKIPYKQVKYKDDYAPPEFKDKVPAPQCSKQFKAQSKTT